MVIWLSFKEGHKHNFYVLPYFNSHSKTELCFDTAICLGLIKFFKDIFDDTLKSTRAGIKAVQSEGQVMRCKSV